MKTRKPVLEQFRTLLKWLHRTHAEIQTNGHSPDRYQCQRHLLQQCNTVHTSICIQNRNKSMLHTNWKPSSWLITKSLTSSRLLIQHLSNLTGCIRSPLIAAAPNHLPPKHVSVSATSTAYIELIKYQESRRPFGLGPCVTRCV